MIAFVNGTIEEFYEDRVVIDTGAFGVNVFVSAGTASMLPPRGSSVKLYTYTQVREDSFSLYGFLTRDELALFKKLITVSGIGPKGGLSILSVMSAEDLRFAILSGDSGFIAKAPGIGKKTAEKVIVDLRDKVAMDDRISLQGMSGNEPSVQTDGGAKNEAVNALVALGYRSKEAYEAVNRVEGTDTKDVEAVLKEALTYLL